MRSQHDRCRRHRQRRPAQRLRRPLAGAGEPLGQQHRQVVGEQPGEILSAVEGFVGRPVVRLDPRQQPRQASVAPGGGPFHVDELGFVPAEQVLVFKARGLLSRGHPSVLLPVNPDEHLALSEISPVELTGRMRPCPELEHHRGQVQPGDRAPGCVPLSCELLEGRGYEDPDPPIGRADVRPLAWHPRRGFHDHRGHGDWSRTGST